MQDADPAPTKPDESPAPPDPLVPAATTARTNPTIIALVSVAVVLLASILAINLGPRRQAPGTPNDLATLKAEIEVRRAAINAERKRLGLPPLEGTVSGGESPADVAARLGRDATTLAGMTDRLAQLLKEKDQTIAEKNAALLSSEQSRQAVTDRLARLRQELDTALVDGSSADLLRRQLADSQQKADSLRQQLEEAQDALANAADRPDPAELDTLRRRLDEVTRARDFFENRTKELEAELASLRSKPADLFADNENEMLPAVVKLFQTLRQLENKPDSEISSAYSLLGADLGAAVHGKYSFPTGSSTLGPQDEQALRDLAGQFPDNGVIVAFGYASETGNVDNNRELSSARATTVATLLDSVKRGSQKVQAAYLGQTDRFSSRIPERNQIVEVWHIAPK